MDTNEYSLGDRVRAIRDCDASTPFITKGDVYQVSQRKNGLLWLDGNNGWDQGHPPGEFEPEPPVEPEPIHHEMPRVDVDRINKILQESSGWRDIDGVEHVGISADADPVRLNQSWNYTPEFFRRVGLEVRVQVREIKQKVEGE